MGVDWDRGGPVEPRGGRWFITVCFLAAVCAENSPANSTNSTATATACANNAFQREAAEGGGDPSCHCNAGWFVLNASEPVSDPLNPCTRCPLKSHLARANDGSASCPCLLGYYRAGGDPLETACVKCESGHFCSSGGREACPAVSPYSQGGSSSLDDCTCDDGYGVVNRLVTVTVDGANSTEYQRECEQCSTGSFARRGERGGCRVCPLGSTSAQPGASSCVFPDTTPTFSVADGLELPVETDDPDHPGYKFVEFRQTSPYRVSFPAPLAVSEYLLVGGGGSGVRTALCNNCGCSRGGAGGGGEVVFRQGQQLVLEGEVGVQVLAS